MLIQELKEILHDQAYVLQDTYFESSQIYQLIKTCGFEHTSHEIFLNFLLQNLYNFFFCAPKLHQ